jgi:hypothetical protein
MHGKVNAPDYFLTAKPFVEIGDLEYMEFLRWDKVLIGLRITAFKTDTLGLGSQR